MGLEIERKFLVTPAAWMDGLDWVTIDQGYLLTSDDWHLRVRLAGPQAFLTIKEARLVQARREFEYPIPVDDARELLEACDARVTKQRVDVEVDGRRWQLDHYRAPSELWLAEVELTSPDEALIVPSWAHTEVTGDPRYYASTIAGTPG